MNEKLVRQRLKKTIFKNLTSIANVLSVSFVGSFAECKNLSGISDIDTVVICDHLTEDVFNSCIEAVDSINLSDHGLQEYILKINSSFGPLKFDEHACLSRSVPSDTRVCSRSHQITAAHRYTR